MTRAPGSAVPERVGVVCVVMRPSPDGLGTAVLPPDVPLADATLKLLPVNEVSSGVGAIPGACGASGIMVSIVNASGAEAALTLPARSVAVTASACAPCVRAMLVTA